MLKISVPHTQISSFVLAIAWRGSQGASAMLKTWAGMGSSLSHCCRRAAKNMHRGQAVQSLLGTSTSHNLAATHSTTKQITYEILSVSLLDECFLRY